MYKREVLFPYAIGYYLIIPRGIEDKYSSKNGTLIKENEYAIFFKEDTPKEIIERFTKEYSEYYEKKKNEGIW